MPAVKLAPILMFLFAAAANAQDASRVQATAVADVASIAPGKPFKIGVEFKIDPGWHIYWINPGDSGLPTRLIPDLPAGYTAGPLEYPTPKRIALPGNIVNYGYEDDVLLTMTITPPATIAAGSSVTIPVRATWLVCKDDCVPGSSDLTVTLPIGDAKPSTDAQLFADWAKRMPKSAAEAGFKSISTRYQSVDQLRAECVSANGPMKDFDFAPEPIPGWEVADFSLTAHEGSTGFFMEFKLKKAGDRPPPDVVEGLLLLQTAGDPVGVKITFHKAAATTRPAG
jgi:DsbC/DsbD-like thiol-disulfide interchange protein